MGILDNINNNPFFVFFVAIIGILGFAYAIYCQHKNKDKKQFSYYLSSSKLKTKNESKLSKFLITYDGELIDNLCISKFTIWNSGNKMLNYSDMVKGKELIIYTLGEHKILDVELIASTERTNEFSIELIDDYSAKIKFNYVDINDGIIVQVIHTGSNEDICIESKIKDGYPIRNINKTEQGKNKKIISYITAGLGVVCIGFFLFMSIFSCWKITNLSENKNSFFNLIPKKENNGNLDSVVLLIISLILIVLMIIYFIVTIRKTYNLGIPEKLRKLDQ